MFAFLSRPRAARASRLGQFGFEQLEGRRLLSAASDVLDLDGASIVATREPDGITVFSVKITKLEGNFVGHYIGVETGEHPLTFDITRCTHTGHFTGECVFTTSKGHFPADVTGVIRSDHHVDLTFQGTGFQGSMTGIASHTGGSFSGDFTVTGDVNSHGTYKVAKP